MLPFFSNEAGGDALSLASNVCTVYQQARQHAFLMMKHLRRLGWSDQWSNVHAELLGVGHRFDCCRGPGGPVIQSTQESCPSIKVIIFKQVRASFTLALSLSLALFL